MFNTNPPQPSFPERREYFSAKLKSHYFNLAEVSSSLAGKGGWEGFFFYSNWSDYTVTTETLFTRGYTGHEHLDDFSLINMNGSVPQGCTVNIYSDGNLIESVPSGFYRYGDIPTLSLFNTNQVYIEMIGSPIVDYSDEFAIFVRPTFDTFITTAIPW